MKGKKAVNKAAIKAELLERYSVAVDELLEESEGVEEFEELEECVNVLAQKTLPKVLSTLQDSKDFPPEMPHMPKTTAK